jgi:Rhs family protein
VQHSILIFLFAYILSLSSLATAALVDETSTRLLPDITDDSYSLVWCDVDGVNGPDIFVANKGQCRLFINDGNGNFTDETSTRLPSMDDTIIAADFGSVDNDSDFDLILASFSGQNRLLINDGNGKFTDETGSRMPVNVQKSMSVQFGDLNGNNTLDIFVTNHGSQNRVLINNGSGIFTDETLARIAVDSDMSYAAKLVDVNGSGNLDIVVANHGQNRLFINNGLGLFADDTLARLPASNGDSIDTTCIDLDNDNDSDILFADGAGGLSLLENNGSGVFSDVSAAKLPVLNDFIIKVGTCDVDFDGTPDILLANAGQDRVLLNNSSGIFSDASGSELPVDISRTFGLSLLDIEGDLDCDLAQAKPSSRNRLLVNNISYPRLLVSVEPDYIEEGDPVTVTVTAFDEDGINTTSLTIIGPDAPGGVIIPLVAGVGTYTPTIDGDYTATATAEDNNSETATINVMFPVLDKDTTDPVVVLVVNPLTVLHGQSVDISVTANDDRRVVSTALKVNGVDVPLDVTGNATYVTTATGSFAVEATASDAAGNETTDSTILNVNPDNEVPVVSVTALPDPVDLINPVTITVVTSDNVAVSSRTLTVTGPSDPGGVILPLDGAGQATYVPFLPGQYTAAVNAFDPAGNEGIDNTTFDAQGIPDVDLPTVNLEIVPRTVAIGGSVDLKVTASDNIGVTETSLEINGTPVVLDVDGNATYTPPIVGDYTAVATARDGTGNEGSDSKVFRAVDPVGDSTPPFVEITFPSDDQEVTEIVDILGTASDDTLVQYTLDYAPVGSAGYTTLATGNFDVIDDVLGTIDPTLLENGFYEIRLTAEDINGTTASTSVVVNVTGELKLGQFELSFQDESLNVGRFPLTVTRSYDSRNRSEKGDFGFGWNVSLTDAELIENRSPSDNWQTQDLGGFTHPIALVPTRPHTVKIKFGEEVDVSFRAQPNPESQAFAYEFMNGMNYIAIGETNGTLVALGQGAELFFGGEVMDLGLNSYNPPQFRYDTDDGFSYTFTENSQDSLRHTLTNVEDPNGTTVSITTNGFIRSDGLSLGFVRDSEGRIIELNDPMGNITQYDYDSNGDLVGVTDPENNRTAFVYDSNHYLTEIIDPLGRTVQRQEYDENGRLIAITDAAGNSIDIEYNVSTNTQIIRDRRGNPTIYEYDGRGNVTRKTEFPTVNDVVQQVESNFEYNVDSDMTADIDQKSVRTEYTYSTEGYLLSETNDVGGLNLKREMTYDSAGRLLTDKDPRGNTSTNVYDANGNLLTSTDREGKTTTNTYNASGLVTRITDPLGDYTEYGYDAFGNKTREERFESGGGSLRKAEFTYDNNGNKLTETVYVTRSGSLTPLTTTFEYDANDKLIRTIDPLLNEIRTEYDVTGQKSAEIDARGKRTEFTYDSSCPSSCGSTGSLIRTDYSDGTFKAFEYDADGNRTAVTDREGNKMTVEFDSLNRTIRRVHPDSNFKKAFFDKVGNVISEMDENGNMTDHEYDSVGRRVRTILPLVPDAISGTDIRPETIYEYDENGNRTAVVDALNNRTEYAFDKENRLTVTTFPDLEVASTTYDALGREIAKTDPVGLTNTNDYDALGRLIAVTLPPPASGDPNTITSYEYDEAGNLITQADANGHITKFEYDKVGRKTARELPGLQKETFTYDAAGNRLTCTDFNADTTIYEYDDVNRGTKAIYADESSVLTTYTGTDKMLKVTDSRGDTDYTYDTRGRLTSITYPDASAVTYVYDASGNRTSVTSPGGATTYTYDAIDRLETVTDASSGVTEYGYDLIGNLINVINANGVKTTHTYNNRNQLTGLVTTKSDSTVIDSYVYTLDTNGMREDVTELDGSVVTYEYDDNYRLTRETRTGTNPYDNKYQYDAVGNRTSMDRDGVVTAYTYDANDRLQSAGAFTHVYDDNGNTISKTDGVDLTTYSYDYENRLINSLDPSGVSTTYTYDPLGNRVRKVDGAGTVNYIVDPRNNTGVTQVLEERDAAGALQVFYTYGHDLLQQDRAGSESYYHYDGHGSTRLLTIDTEAVSDTYIYDAYGRTVVSTGTTVNNYLYGGEQFDPNVGLYYLRARYYDQTTGRFFSVDPFDGDPQSPISLHKYLYANSNPVNFIDPTGEFSLVSVMISVSINSSIQSVYTTNVAKLFFTALKIAACIIEPGMRLQELGVAMLMSGAPGGENFIGIGRDLVAGGFKAIGVAIQNTYANIGNEIISFSGPLADAYEFFTGDELQLFHAEELEPLLEDLESMLSDIGEDTSEGCEKAKLLEENAHKAIDKLGELL